MKKKVQHHIGDIIEWTYWLTGEETQEEIADFTSCTQMAFYAFEQDENVMLSKPEASVLHPGDPRVPEVPEHIHGSNVQLLVFESRVILHLPGPKLSRFADELEKDDFNRLAKITREHYTRRFPRSPRLSDGQVRTVINDLGEEVALETLRGQVEDTTEFIQ
jgi:hypothetical protein